MTPGMGEGRVAMGLVGEGIKGGRAREGGGRCRPGREREQLLLIGDIKLVSEGDVTGPGASKGLIHSPTAVTRSG